VKSLADEKNTLSQYLSKDSFHRRNEIDKPEAEGPICGSGKIASVGENHTQRASNGGQWFARVELSCPDRRLFVSSDSLVPRQRNKAYISGGDPVKMGVRPDSGRASGNLVAERFDVSYAIDKKPSRSLLTNNSHLRRYSGSLRIDDTII
jgi:hypothetical protein